MCPMGVVILYLSSQTTRPPETRDHRREFGIRAPDSSFTRNSFGPSRLTEKNVGGGGLTVLTKCPGVLSVASQQVTTPPRESKNVSREGSLYNGGATILGRGDSTILSSAALTEPIGRSEALDPILISHTLHCLTECSQDPMPRSTSTNRRAEIVSPSGAFEQLRSTLRSINPSDPTLAAFDSTRVRGAPWLIQVRFAQ